MQRFKENSASTHGAFTDLIMEGIEKGIFVNEHPAALADLLWATYAGAVLWIDSKSVLYGQRNHIKSTLNTAYKIISRGLLKMK